MKKLILLACIVLASLYASSQIQFDNFIDGDYTVNPLWSGTNDWWVGNSDASGPTISSQTLRVLTTTTPGTSYLSSPIYNWSTNQEWGIFIGRRTQHATAAFQSYFWLYANEADLNSPTVDGYRIAFGDDNAAGDRIRLEYIVDGAVSSTLITSSGSTANGIYYFGFLLRIKRSAAGVWEMYTSTLPQASITGARATDIPNTANTPVNQGTGTNNALIPATNGYIGVGALHALPAEIALEFDQVYFTPSPVTAPVMTITPLNLDSFYAVVTNPSASKPYTVQGTNLTSDIVVGGNGFPNNDCEVSLTETPFVPATIHLTPVAGTVPLTTLYMRLHSAAYVGVVAESVLHTTTGIPIQSIGCIGFVIGPEPTIQGSLSFGARTNNSIVVNMNGGNGARRILFVKESSAVDVQPIDAHPYGSGLGLYGVSSTQVGNGNYVVYNGSANSVTVTGLTPNRIYHFAVFEYNKAFGLMWGGGPGDYDDYQTENYMLQAGTGIETTFGALPIIINYINGTKQGSKHLLNWKVTCISTPRVTMILERSADSRNFTSINSITADAVRCNQPFDYTDSDPLKGMNYYRLKMTDADGKISYSSIVALLNAVKGFDIISIAPNPVVDGNFKLNVTSAQAGKMDVAIYDMQGRLVNRQSISLIAGFNNAPINVADLSPGTYTVQGTIADDRSRVIHFVKQ